MAKILYDYWFVQFDFPNEWPGKRKTVNYGQQNSVKDSAPLFKA